VLSEERLKEIRERLEKATPGPWEWERADESDVSLGTKGSVYFEGHVLSCGYCKSCQKSGQRCTTPRETDSQFIANAPTDIADLLKEVEELRGERAEVRRLRQEVSRLRALMGPLEKRVRFMEDNEP